jgi:UDP-N-acetylglucosamine 3-dehydrogenase
MTGPVRLALLGCGTIARDVHLPAFAAAGRDLVDVTVFASRSMASAERAAGQWGSGDVTTNWQEAVERDDVDAVDICAPNGLHRAMTVAACAAGKHVLVEKPMAVSLDDADAMIAAADAAGRVLMPAQNIRFAPACRAAGRALADGRIGELVGIRAVLGHTGPQDWAPGADWFFDREQSGGGALLDLGVHLFDLVRAVTGDEIAVEGAVLKPRASAPGIEDAAEVAFRLGRGAIGSLRASWDTTPPSGIHLTLVGTTGTIAVQAGKTGRPVLRGADGTTVELDLPEPANPYAMFAAAAAGRVPAPLGGRDGKAAVAAVLAAYACAGRS